MGTNHAFAVELLIKGILISKDIQYKKIHKLDTLIKLLPQECVESIKQSFESKANNQTSFEDLLETHADMFIKMRYACAQTPPTLDMDFTSHLTKSLRTKLKTICGP